VEVAAARHQAAWARAAGLSPEELQEAVDLGREAEARLITSNAGLVRSAIRALQRSGGGRIDHGTTEQDLMQEGSISLIKAAEKFDVSLGLRFSTYATYWIRNALTRTIREQSRTIRLPSRVQTVYAKIVRAKEELRAGAAFNPTDEEVAALVGDISAAKVRQVVELVNRRATSLDAPSGDDLTVGDFLPDERAETAQAEMVQSMLQRDLQSVMTRYLTEEEAKVVQMRFGLGGSGETMAVKEVGEALGLSFHRVKNVLFAALSKLRKPHVSLVLRDYVGDEEG